MLSCLERYWLGKQTEVRKGIVICDQYGVLAFLSVLDRGFEPIFRLSSLLVSVHFQGKQ
jgi:hypothetical protein